MLDILLILPVLCWVLFDVQVFSMSSNTGELWFVRPHFPSGICRGRDGGHQSQCWISAEQGAAVGDVEYCSLPTY